MTQSIPQSTIEPFRYTGIPHVLWSYETMKKYLSEKLIENSPGNTWLENGDFRYPKKWEDVAMKLGAEWARAYEQDDGTIILNVKLPYYKTTIIIHLEWKSESFISRRFALKKYLNNPSPKELK